MKSHHQDRVSVRIENNWQDTSDAGPMPKENWKLWHNSQL
jgi:hypothetical protein